MAAVRRDGTAPELLLRHALRANGIVGYRLNVRSLPGSPDVVFVGKRIAIFVDGAFWHGHPRKFPEKKMSEYWLQKIERNRARDERASEQLRNLGWKPLRFWDFEVESEPERIVGEIRLAMQQTVAKK
jgi:DNA mismatch endonuclease (patch repair protein)